VVGMSKIVLGPFSSLPPGGAKMPPNKFIFKEEEEEEEEDDVHGVEEATAGQCQ
jgi:hypothetical protein